MHIDVTALFFSLILWGMGHVLIGAKSGCLAVPKLGLHDLDGRTRGCVFGLVRKVGKYSGVVWPLDRVHALV